MSRPTVLNGVPDGGPDEATWYKDAVIYELHVRAFRDGNRDGVGDFRGSPRSSTTCATSV